MQNVVHLTLAFTVLATAAIAPAPTTAPAPHAFIADYRSDENVPTGLLDAYVTFAKAAQATGDVSALPLPQAVEITTAGRPENGREYGTNINVPYLKSGFSP